MTPGDPVAEDLARRINEQSFDPVRLKPGYDMGVVDEILDRLVAAVRAGEPVRPLLAKRPPLVTFREGYRIESVDAFLDGVLRELGEQSPSQMGSASSGTDDASARAEGATAPVTDDRHAARFVGSEVIQEQKGFWHRLLGRD